MRNDIKLNNPEFCNGCPYRNCVNAGGIVYTECRRLDISFKDNQDTFDAPRPQDCIDKYGI